MATSRSRITARRTASLGRPRHLADPRLRPARPPRGRSQAHGGVAPLSAFTHRTQRFQPLPPPLGEPPYHMDLGAVVPGVTRTNLSPTASSSTSSGTRAASRTRSTSAPSRRP